MTRCLLAVGSNLGDRAATLSEALSSIIKMPHVTLFARSKWHETEAVGGPAGQQSFLNGAVLLDANCSPHVLAAALHKTETHLGRQRKARWDSRTLDIDLLLWGDAVIDSSDLRIPHPRMSFRRFVLDPAAEIAGEMVHADTGWTIAALLKHWQTAPRTIGVVSSDPQLRSWVSDELLKQLSLRGSDQREGQEIKFAKPSEATNASLVITIGGVERLRRPGLRIPSNDRKVVLREALAAIQAAWPE